MSKDWRQVALGEAVAPVGRPVVVEPLTEYPLLGIRLDGGGPFRRETKKGSQISAKTLFRVKSGDFIYSRLFAWRGAFGIVPEALDGCLVSNEFRTFVPRDSRIDVRFLNYWFRLSPVLRCVEADCTGSTPLTRNRYKEEFFLRLRIPLPPLTEQRRIVVRIEELAGKIAEARGIRDQGVLEAEALFERARASAFAESGARDHLRLEDAAVLARGKFSHRPRNDPRFFGGAHPWIQISEIERSDKFIRNYSKTLNDHGLAVSRKFPRGTVLVSIAATIGAVGILDFDCCVPDSIVAVIPREDAESEFLYHFLGYVRAHLEDLAPQSAQKNINLKILAPLPVPRLASTQQRVIVGHLDELRAQTDVLKRQQAETAAELDALLPSILDKAFKAEL